VVGEEVELESSSSRGGRLVLAVLRVEYGVNNQMLIDFGAVHWYEILYWYVSETSCLKFC
jgi:hypothetical protein